MGQKPFHISALHPLLGPQCTTQKGHTIFGIPFTCSSLLCLQIAASSKIMWHPAEQRHPGDPGAKCVTAVGSLRKASHNPKIDAKMHQKSLSFYKKSSKMTRREQTVEFQTICPSDTEETIDASKSSAGRFKELCSRSS